ncbi:hypothetical protein [Flavobacterium pallidum]|uniref:Uncharacterized protein n=1 Tax=Flavobacterium pallidum TaxID=2172098 RepID=A0A2S1SKA8_9FLAO|nr:hypothetical protein [Flavobacterium pallidum]AWI26848.1 hypothetical protein HYN49_13585 [Flavobacterium pallidum]
MEEYSVADAMRKYESDEIQNCLRIIDENVGYKLLPEDKQIFDLFHEFVTNPQPKFITDWRSDEKKERWYHKFINRFLDDTQNALICVQYHHDKLLQIEKTILEQVEQHNYRKVLDPNTVLGISNTLVWDFEYQAFVLAYRRTLDYFTRGVCCYFTNDFHSFRKIGDFLQKQNRPVFTKPLIDIFEKNIANFDFVMSEGERKSIRDRITHYEYTKVGVINLTSDGLILIGGAEDLGLEGNNLKLSEVIEQRTHHIKSFLRDFITAYINAIKNEEIQSKN